MVISLKDRALLAVLPPDAKEVVEFSAERTSSNEETPPHQRIDIYISLWRVDDKEMLWRIPANDLELNEMGYIGTSPEGDYLAMIGISNGFDIWEIKE